MLDWRCARDFVAGGSGRGVIEYLDKIVIVYVIVISRNRAARSPPDNQACVSGVVRAQESRVVGVNPGETRRDGHSARDETSRWHGVVRNRA